LSAEEADRYLDMLIAAEGGKRPRYQRMTQQGLTALIPDLLYRGRLLDTVLGGSVTLTLFLRLGDLGGALWEQEMRILERIGGLEHPSLPVLDDGGYLKATDGARGAAFIRTKAAGTPADIGELQRLFQERRGDALPHLWLLADALAVLHDSQIAHRLLWPGNLDVERENGAITAVRLSRFEMGGLLSNLFDTGRTLSLSQVRQLYLDQPDGSLLYSPPERLRFLFDRENGQLGGPKGDVFSLGMMATEWLLGPASDGAPPVTYDDILQWQAGTRTMLARRRNQLPSALAEVLAGMLDLNGGNRPTAYEVSQQVAAGYSDARAVLDDDLPTEPYLIAYMPDECDKTLLKWDVTHASADTEEGRDELVDLIEGDIRGVEILHSPNGAEGFVSGSVEKLRRAKTVIIGHEITWFADLLWMRPDEGPLIEYDEIMVIRFSQRTSDIAEKLNALRVNALIRRVPAVEAIAMPTDEEVAEAYRSHRPSWKSLVLKVESGRVLPEEEQAYLEALDWYLRYQRALLAARTYAYVLEPGSARGRATLRWDTATDRTRTMSDPLQRRMVNDSRRPCLTDFVVTGGEAVGSNGAVSVRLEVASSRDGFGMAIGPLDVLAVIGTEALEVDTRRIQDIPAKGWLRLESDAGTMPQINRQAAARVELASQRVLLQQLTKPKNRPHLESSQWDGAGGELKGEGRDAVVEILKHGALFALQGPPGTGKTEVTSQAVAEYVAAKPRSRILVSAQSHDALENLAGRILDKLDMTESPGRAARLDRLALRVGGTRRRDGQMDRRVASFLPAALADGVIAYSTSRAKDWLASRRTERPALVPVVKEWLETLPNSRLELNRRVRVAANIVFSTTGAATPDNLILDATDEPFHWVLVEEAARAWPTELALPLVRGVRWTLVGDHAQIGAFSKADIERFLMECKDDPSPEIHAMYEASADYAKAFGTFAELFNSAQSKVPRMTLTQQYRMDQQISSLIGDTFYADSGGLKACREPAANPLSGPEYLLGSRLVWIDTGEAARAVGFWSNDNEANLCARVVRAMRPAPGGPDGTDLAVLTPYRQQVHVLHQRLSEHASRVFTIDGFQGREADVVVASLVRDRAGRDGTPISSVGHVAASSRANVLLSRARELLVVVGRFEIYAHHAGPKWRQVTEHFRKHGSVVRAEEVGGS
jgi:hypothetical protein